MGDPPRLFMGTPRRLFMGTPRRLFMGTPPRGFMGNPYEAFQKQPLGPIRGFFQTTPNADSYPSEAFQKQPLEAFMGSMPRGFLKNHPYHRIQIASRPPPGPAKGQRLQRVRCWFRIVLLMQAGSTF